MAFFPRTGFIRASRVFSVDSSGPVDSLWWQDGRIVEVGSSRDLAGHLPVGTPHYDFAGGLVTPGFVDSHTHFAMWALGRHQVQLAGASTRAEALARVALVAPLDGWVTGQGWDSNGWAEPPERAALDGVQGAPVFLHSVDVHAAWVNTAALRLAGIGPRTPDPFGGKIVRDGAGQPTGLLLERAVDLVRDLLPDPPLDRVVTALLEGQAEAHRLGITGIHDVENHLAYEAFSRLVETDRLRLRVLFHHPVVDLERLVRDQVRSGAGGDWLTHGGVKMFLDGSLGSRTAWMLAPYEGSRERGMPISEEATARAATALAARSGLASVVHAIGDAAVRRALDLMEDLPRTAIPHRIEHFQCVHPADLDRAARHGIVLSMQPAHLLTDIPLADRHWGGRGAGAYAFASLLERGALLAFGSDTPVASLDPREGVFAATERRAEAGAPAWYPGERIALQAAIAAYTAGPAIAAGVGGRRGRLAPGMDADLVVWDGAALSGEGGAGFRQAAVLLTVVGGEVVYNSPFAA